MRLKPITLSPIALGAVLVIALCGATQPADQPSEPAQASAFDAAFEPAPAVPAETPIVGPEDTAPAQPSLDAAVLQTPETPSPAMEDPPKTDGATVVPSADAGVPAVPAEATAPVDTPIPAEAIAPADKPAVPEKGKPPTKEYFVGVWAEAGQSCETALDFKADGTLIGPFPRWELSDTGELTMVGNRQKIFLTVVDANTIQSRRSPTDPPRTLKRCSGG
ncbi:MAG: hypothetical protein JWQ16_1585 [Novosphingobium sp.]|nr:hypothetical protein [Novosphingobium sp.]